MRDWERWEFVVCLERRELTKQILSKGTSPLEFLRMRSVSVEDKYFVLCVALEEIDRHQHKLKLRLRREIIANLPAPSATKLINHRSNINKDKKQCKIIMRLLRKYAKLAS